MSEATTTAKTTALTARETELAVLALQSLKNGFIQIDEGKFAKLGGYSNARSANVCFANLKKKLNAATEEEHYVAAGTGGAAAKATPKKGTRGKTNPKTPTKRKADDNFDSTPTKRSKDGNQVKEEDQDGEASTPLEAVNDNEV
ncbi:MAG: hypothetical protein Q9186_005843 [Xanthomendoza sp. 1 TL-2023]